MRLVVPIEGMRFHHCLQQILVKKAFLDGQLKEEKLQHRSRKELP